MTRKEVRQCDGFLVHTILNKQNAFTRIKAHDDGYNVSVSWPVIDLHQFQQDEIPTILHDAEIANMILHNGNHIDWLILQIFKAGKFPSSMTLPARVRQFR